MNSLIALFLVLLAMAGVIIICRANNNCRRQQETKFKVVATTRLTAVEKDPIAKQEPQLIEDEVRQQPVAVESQLITLDKNQQIAREEAQLTALTERERIEIVQPEIKLEEQIQATTEIQLTSIEETRSTKEHKTKPMEEDVTQWLKAEQIQSMPTELEQLSLEVKRPEPIDRGGRSRTSSQDREKQPGRKTRHRTLKPEIICWKRERQWVVAVEVMIESLEKSSVKVLQNGSLLQQDETEECYWLLQKPFGKVIASWNEVDTVQEAEVELQHDGYLLFKLGGRNFDQGRLVKFPSSGMYLVIVPEDWARDEMSSGPPPAASEPVFFTGYQAHFFDLEKNSNEKIAFRLPYGQQLVIEPKTLRFELIGSQLEDANEYMGPLFGNDVPRIYPLDEQAWKNVGTIIVGEEGRGRGRWRTGFAPNPDQTEQDLPSELADRKSGWYFIRFYNTDDELIESLDFRFVSSLKQIVFSKSRPLPLEDGHKPVYVEFMHEPDCAIQLVENHSSILLDHQHDKTIVTILPDPTCDQSHWLVCPRDGSPVELIILVERIWWALTREDHIPSQWTDKPLMLSRDDFAAVSCQALWLKLPKRRWADKVLVGFEHSKARPYDVKVTEKTVSIPLRDFGDCAEVRDRALEYHLKLWIYCDHQVIEGILAILPASQVTIASKPAPVISPQIQFWVGLGRKKTAIAEAVMQNGSGEIKVNGRQLDDYFGQTPRQAKQFLGRLLNLKEVRTVLSQMELHISVKGSSPTTTQQAKAVAHAVARALMSYDLNLKVVLKQAGFGGIKVKDAEAIRRGER